MAKNVRNRNHLNESLDPVPNSGKMSQYAPCLALIAEEIAISRAKIQRILDDRKTLTTLVADTQKLITAHNALAQVLGSDEVLQVSETSTEVPLDAPAVGSTIYLRYVPMDSGWITIPQQPIGVPQVPYSPSWPYSPYTVGDFPPGAVVSRSKQAWIS